MNPAIELWHFMNIGFTATTSVALRPLWQVLLETSHVTKSERV